MIAKITLATVVIAALPMATKGCAPDPAEAYAGSAVGAVCTVDKKTRAKLGLNAEQADNAAAVIGVAKDRGLPERAAVIGIATTLQESELSTYPRGDNDGGRAYGIFQQHATTRGTGEWGTITSALNAASAATKFFEHLEKVKGWQDMSLTRAAQRVQRSADGSLYAQHEDRATRIVAKLTACKDGA